MDQHRRVQFPKCVGLNEESQTAAPTSHRQRFGLIADGSKENCEDQVSDKILQGLHREQRL